MDTQKYNGWTNYATWLVNLHFENLDFTDEVDSGVFDDMSKDDIRCYVASWIQELVESYLEERLDTNDSFVIDVINSTINDADWHDIADNYVDEILDAVKDKELVAAWFSLTAIAHGQPCALVVWGIHPLVVYPSRTHEQS